MSAHVPAVDDPSRRQWLSFEHGGDTWTFDVTFLMSNWSCIFGRGCKGVHDTDTTDLGHGCCSFGAHFADPADRKRVRKAASRLTRDQWQFKRLAKDLGGAIVRNEDDEWVTRTHDGACIFLNRPGFDRGAGCALHVGAADAGEHFLDWKPEVCWQLPLRLTYHDDEVGHTTHTLREWKRRDWGEGGLEFHWWCTDSAEAFVGDEPVVLTQRDEIVAMVGEEVYERLLEHLDLEHRPRETWLPHPARRATNAQA
ncbi:MAG: hypothetical protein ACOYOP_04575 [Microthrixaceae bacterium]